MPIVQSGSINTAALVVPNLYVQIVPPQNLVINGVPTNVIGVVGTASWGPVNTPTAVGSAAQYFQNYGSLSARKFDMGTQVATAIQQGATAFRCVRATDGTDLASTIPILAGMVLTARYTGTRGNGLGATITAGSAAGTLRMTIGFPNSPAELYDNISPSWVAIIAAVNNGIGTLRGPSQLVVASVGASPNTAAAYAAVTLAGGTDGAAVTPAALMGQDVGSRSGLYALRGQGCSLVVVADLDSSSNWSTLAQFGYTEGAYMIVAGPSGDTIATAVAAKQTAGLDDYAVKVMLGDYPYWNDTANSVVRPVSPQGYIAGRLANLSPEQSSLNKPVYSAISTQRLGVPGSSGSTTYSDAELAVLGQAGIDVITNPAPAGAIYAARFGHNSSTDPTRSGDNYTRMTNFIASTLNAGMGRFVGRTITNQLFAQIRATLLQFMGDLMSQNVLGPDADGNLPYSVVCDRTNNPPTRTSLGYVQADVQVRFLAINEKFIVNLEGGTTVNVTRQTLPNGQR